MIFLALFFFLLGLFLMLIPLLTSFKQTSTRELFSPFECGFDPYHSSRIPFSLQFFLIALIFLIFDIEITLLLPLPLTFTLNSPLIYFLCSTLFIFILLVGTYYEWFSGALTWYN